MDLIEERKSQPISQDIALVDAGKALAKNKLKRYLLAFAGTLVLVLAVLGVFVPGLPCTPFALLSAGLFAKSSERLYTWLLNNKILGPRIKDYQRNKGISRQGKVKVLILMWCMVLVSSFVIVDILSIRIIILSAGVVGSVVILFFVPEAKTKSAKQN